ncbi:MAG: hypothetical protein KGZ54_04270, partial [Dethiobacter sp.]|nr:hypothetical protein [Dethiobacter sp.]MBS3901217.1 hypothetical protein [Dethiobacter sp.]
LRLDDLLDFTYDGFSKILTMYLHIPILALLDPRCQVWVRVSPEGEGKREGEGKKIIFSCLAGISKLPPK